MNPSQQVSQIFRNSESLFHQHNLRFTGVGKEKDGRWRAHFELKLGDPVINRLRNIVASLHTSIVIDPESPITPPLSYWPRDPAKTATTYIDFSLRRE